MSRESMPRQQQCFFADHRSRTRNRLRRGFSQLELQAPAMLASLSNRPRFPASPLPSACAPNFTGTNRSPALPNRSTAFNGACRCSSPLFGSNSTTSPALILRPRARAVQAERHRLVRDQLQIARIELDRRAFFRSARRQAHRAQRFALSSGQPDEVGARQARRAPAVPRRSRGRRNNTPRPPRPPDPDRDSRRSAGRSAVPMLHHIRHALAQDFGNEESAVEQNRVGRAHSPALARNAAR